MQSAATPDIDRILDAIRAEARARGSKGAVGGYDAGAVAGGEQLALPGLAPPEVRHASDFLALPLDVFVATAYRRILAREPDAAGAAHYQRALLRGSLTRVEMLGRLALSAEARRRGQAVPGIVPAFAFALLYRVPLAGPIAALAARLLRLPAHLQDRSTLEAVALATGTWMKR